MKENITVVQVIDKDIFKEVLQKVVDKVMKAHATEADATFLLSDAGRIQRLVQDYLHHLKA